MFSTVVGNIQENKRFNNMLLMLLDSVSLWVMASVMGCCIILARFYGNVGLGSNDSFFSSDVCLRSFHTEQGF